VFNQVVPQALAALAAKQRPELWHVAGPVELEVTREVYAQAGIPARVDGFVEDIAQAYAWADLALCRAGALTISELAAAGLGALLVPYPYAVDDHQRGNAEFLVRVGAARLLTQTSLTPNTLAAALKEVGQRARCVEMALAARTQAKPDAAAEVARHCLEVGHG
jgi:UDP-N-acetylglucosamine--N-acetylmuramyl-(pentapeptide) pyrophosphoryl-undecaprenol N-acetylglucosamine transferase